MYSFANDYSEGACQEVLDALLHSNLEQTSGYGLDEYCEQARKTIRSLLRNDQVDVHFLVGGTQANTIIIASALRPYEAVISVESGHINVHETGAIEASGHKVITVNGKNGKITPDSITQVIKQHTDEHMVKPKMVYLSLIHIYILLFSVKWVFLIRYHILNLMLSSYIHNDFHP